MNICSLFLWCEHAVIPRILSVFSGRRRQWVGPAVSAWSLGSQQQQGPAGRQQRLLLVAGPWEVVMSSRQICKGTEHLAVATAECVSSQGSKSNNSLCLIAVPSSEVIGNEGGACSGTPNGSGPRPPLELVITAVVCPATCRPCMKHPVSLSPRRRCCTGCS